MHWVGMPAYAENQFSKDAIVIYNLNYRDVAEAELQTGSKGIKINQD
jgi:hypothetical protein